MQKNRLSNATIPGVHEAYFANSGKTAVLRFAHGVTDTISSFALDVTNPIKSQPTIVSVANTAGSVGTEPNGTFLTTNIADMIVSSDSKSIFYLVKQGDFSTRKEVGAIYNTLTGKSTAAFQSQFSEWLPVFFSGNTVLLQTKASQLVPGCLYSLNTQTGVFQKIFGDIQGMTALPSPDGNRILYSQSNMGSLSLHMFNRSSGATTDFSLKTLSEKCTWGADSLTLYCAATDSPANGAYPDAWYQGLVSFNDNVWRLNTDTSTINSVLVPTSRANQPMDITNMVLTPDQNYLVFINKKDSTLWMYD